MYRKQFLFNVISWPSFLFLYWVVTRRSATNSFQQARRGIPGCWLYASCPTVKRLPRTHCPSLKDTD